MEYNGRHRWKRWLPFLLPIVLVGGYTAWSLHRPLPGLTPVQQLSANSVKVADGSLTWPGGGQAAVGIPGSDISQDHGLQNPIPIASTAKLITALTVLQEKPLEPGEQGPLITITERDVALYNSYMARDGSVVQVVAGEQMSEYQMLQAIMLPSANNISDTLAIWAFGSLENYSKHANEYVEKLGMRDTNVGSDASGLAPDSVSTAKDLVKLGEAAMKNPVLAEIVGQKTAVLPVVNEVRNVNFLLGTDNIIGVKTGNTEEAGGVFVGAATAAVDGKQVTLVTSVAAAPSLFAAMKDSLNLIRSAQTNFKPVTVAKEGAIVGSYKVPWGGVIAAVTDDNLAVSGWAGSKVLYETRLQPVAGTAVAGQTAGKVVVPASVVTKQRSVSVKLQESPGTPSAWWRLTHPLQ